MNLLQNLSFVALVGGALAIPSVALGCEGTCGGKKASATATAGASATTATASNAANARTVELVLTEKGFEPAEVKVKRGEPVRLLVTRKTDSTCAKEITIEGTDLRRKLPLNQAVEVAFTPSKAGELRFGCGMNKMVGGVLRVE